MGKYRVLRFEFPASSSPNFEFPASGKLGHLNRTEFSAYSSEFSASGKLGQLNLTEFSAYSSEFSAKWNLPETYGWIFFSHNFAQFQVVCEFVCKKKLVWMRLTRNKATEQPQRFFESSLATPVWELQIKMCKIFGNGSPKRLKMKKHFTQF